MATTTELRQKLQAKLKELFQLDQPDLDFGFYRVMHANRKEIADYLDNKLPKAIENAFSGSAQKDIEAKESAYLNAIEQAKAYGSPDPEASEPVKKAKAEWEEAKNSAAGEADIYDHLYHFFERYYDKGDFVSLRYLTRETDRKAKPYAIPYSGEEVMLHWANADQYYIKTSENYSHFSFDLTQFSAFTKMDPMERMTLSIPDESVMVHFEIVDADEGAHANVKESKERFFILHGEKPCEMKEDGLHIYFEHREDNEKSGQTGKWQEKKRDEAFASLKSAIPEGDCKRLMFMELERTRDGKKEKYTPLATYLKRYMARNTSDYFIHKDLGGFLRRELDFYIKNDLMVLDDVAAATPESVAKWLGTLKVFRSIAQDIIAFLAQLEDFQKKLWLKKKFVVQCDWCITLDRVPEELHAEVLANADQFAEWERLGTAEDPRATDLTAIDARMVDTKFFSEEFKQKLLASIPNIDEQCDGVIVHSENFQALGLFQERYREQVKCIYIDPPYNSKTSEILYKNDYKDASWLSLMFNRLEITRNLGNIPIVVAIDENEQEVLSLILKQLYPSYDKTCVSVVHNKKGIQGNYFSFCHEFGIFCIPPEFPIFHGKEIPKDQWEYSNLRKWGRESDRNTAKNCFYPIFVRGDQIIGFGDVCGKDEHPKSANVLLKDGTVAVYPIETTSNIEKKWRYARDTVENIRDLLKVVLTRNGEVQIHKAKASETVKTIWDDTRYIAGDYGTKWLSNLGIKVSESLYPKSIYTVEDSVSLLTDSEAMILDYFGGSGTTAHAVIELNREDLQKTGQLGKRKYILVEMGDHFDTVLKPRIEKVVYSPDWKDGKPEGVGKGISHCFKYLRLESYEDALNNLQVDTEKGKAFGGVKDYLLSYMLDVETKGSPSLLNVDTFAHPFDFRLSVKKPASEERETRTVDLVETFNYLLGLRVESMGETSRYTAEFERPTDSELPEDAHTKLSVKGRIKRAASGEWSFRAVQGWMPRNRATPNDGSRDRVLVVWRNLTDDREKDNAVLNEYLKHKEGVNSLDGEFDVIYVNGSNNVPNLRKEGDTWKIRLIEETFLKRMWEGA